MYKLWNKTIAKWQEKKNHYLGSEITGTPLLHTMLNRANITVWNQHRLCFYLTKSTLNAAGLFKHLGSRMSELKLRLMLCCYWTQKTLTHYHSTSDNQNSVQNELLKLTHPIQSSPYEGTWSTLESDPIMEVHFVPQLSQLHCLCNYGIYNLDKPFILNSKLIATFLLCT